MKLDQENLAEAIEKGRSILPQECFGVVVLGSTGVGKSTLVNAFFPDAKAETGFGLPITQNAKWFPEERKKDQSLRILDTRGLEEKDYQQTLDAAIAAVKDSNCSEDENDHAHVAWLLIKEGSARVQESHIEIAKRFTEADIPVIAVITQAIQRNEEFQAEVRKLLPEVKDVLLVNSEPFEVVGHTIDAFGLPELYYATSRAMPEGGKSRNAFQDAADPAIVPLSDKRDLALRRVKFFTGIATGVGAIPIPIADAAILMPTQAAMMLGISRAYGMKVGENSSIALLSAVTTPVVATTAGTAFAGALLKVFPVIGWLITGAVAGSITFAIGSVYTKFLHYLYEKNGDFPPQVSQVIEEFPEFYNEHASVIKEALKLLKKK